MFYQELNYSTFTGRLKRKFTTSKSASKPPRKRFDGPIYCYDSPCSCQSVTDTQSLKRHGIYIRTVDHPDLIQWNHKQRKPPQGWKCTRYSPCYKCKHASWQNGVWREDVPGEPEPRDCLLFGPGGCKDFEPPAVEEVVEKTPVPESWLNGEFSRGRAKAE